MFLKSEITEESIETHTICRQRTKREEKALSVSDM